MRGAVVRSAVWLLGLVSIQSVTLESSSSHRLSFRAQDSGGLPAWLSRPVPNTFRVVQTGDGIFLTGESGKTAEYQLVSSPFVLRTGTVSVRLRAKGRVRRGALYVALLGDNGGFIGRPQTIPAGPLNCDIRVPAAGTRRLRFVFGNAGGSSGSAWDIYGLKLEELTNHDVDQLAAEEEQSPIFSGELVGSFPPGLFKPVPNSLKVVERAGKILIAGKTGPTLEYQIVSKPIYLRNDTTMISLEVEGTVEAGGIYYTLLDKNGNFWGPMTYRGVGPILAPEIAVMPPAGPVTIVLGNTWKGSSQWLISDIRLSELTEKDRQRYLWKYAQRASFQGSGWWWALQVLRGKIRDPKSKAGP